MDYQKLLEEIGQRQEIRSAEDVNKGNVIRVVKVIQSLLYPEFYKTYQETDEEKIDFIYETLSREIRVGEDLSVHEANRKTESFLNALPKILDLLNKDIQAIYDGDPAAKSKAEIILCYPGFEAIFVYRLAHILYVQGAHLICRIMSEYAHGATGIDIHPGAVIGQYFCIDHGTGIVIGETSVIGDHVKLYQGVTIGAKSFVKDENGNPVKGGKRHPTIGNGVVIYANATILGGDTKIGDNSVIGSSAWITESIEEGTKVR